jgi:GNAT superfamily N-acetyltransferase
MGDPAADADRQAILHLEECAFNAWPALQTLVIDGWLVRFAGGYTKRANSINAWRPTSSVDRLLQDAVPLFETRRLPCIVRVTPLAGTTTDSDLADRDFTLADETAVMSIPLAPGAFERDPSVHILLEPSSDWLGGFASANAVPAIRRDLHDRMVGMIAPPAAFATLLHDGSPIAWGLAVIERGSVGLFDIVTAPAARRQGAARRLVSGLLAWATGRGARQAYLQVATTNRPAVSLYTRIGFVPAYHYHYRIASV